MDSEELLGKWFAMASVRFAVISLLIHATVRFKRTGKRDEIFLATKFGLRSSPTRLINGDPEYVKASIEKSLKRLGVDYVDLYYFHVRGYLVKKRQS